MGGVTPAIKTHVHSPKPHQDGNFSIHSDLQVQVMRGLHILDSLSQHSRQKFRRALLAGLKSQGLPIFSSHAHLAVWLDNASQVQLVVFTLVLLGTLVGRHTFGGRGMCRIMSWACGHLNMSALLSTLPGATLTSMRWSARQGSPRTLAVSFSPCKGRPQRAHQTSPSRLSS